MEPIENKTFDEIKLGDTASLVRTLTYKDIELFAIMPQGGGARHVERRADFDGAGNAAPRAGHRLC